MNRLLIFKVTFALQTSKGFADYKEFLIGAKSFQSAYEWANKQLVDLESSIVVKEINLNYILDDYQQ